MGTTFTGTVLLRMAINPVLTAINITRITAQAAIVLHDFGLPTIMPEVEMQV